ncbi:tRNA (N(6)-L-threonylcarbamoyladenosine(37)-C(2))-methylthiotransferase MtaB [bacterium]|nr:tRNA (N(6)-L-threonylcarbamoyladenosine(37)-C(2))-methylthiotransferase MtaB [bacterium]
MKNKRAAIFTLGCRTNQYDGLLIARSLMDAGFVIVPFKEIADLYVINSCTVTHRGDADSRKSARNALRRNPEAFMVVAGCYSQWAKDAISKIDGVDLILGNREKLNIASFLPEILTKNTEPEIHVSDPTFEESFGLDVVKPTGKSRAMLKIQDGCDQFCSYCIVPHVRGNPRSLGRLKVLSRISELAAMGFYEIVLTGIHLGIWGREFDENLVDLVRAIDDLDGVFRVRLSSIEPMELNNELLDALLHSHRICRHLHAPVQSASDSVLKRMKRPYSISDIIPLFDKLKSADSGWNIGTDLIIGFPGETDDDFNNGIENLKKTPIDYYHLFTYSPRDGTPATVGKHWVSQDKIKSRLNKLKAIDSYSRERFVKSQSSTILTFVIEQKDTRIDDTNIGLSDNYIKAQLYGNVFNLGIQEARLYFDQIKGIYAESIPRES